ncbi:MAG: hypothetical protein ACKOXV_01975 [Bacteroidota bacterium]
MKKLVFYLFFYCIASTSNACDVCGYGNAINTMGLLPQFSNSFLGFRYANQNFITTHPDDNDKEADRFMQIELTGRYVCSERFQCSFSVPYAVNQQVGSDNIHTKGWGDISAFVTYTAMPTTKIGGTSFYHALQLTGGIKMPTGTYKSDFSIPTFNEHLYPGTGTWDIMPAINYIINSKHIGFNLDFSIKYNATNKCSYKMGNQSNGNFKLFYNKNTSVATFIPFIAIGYLSSQADINASNEVLYTGGYEWNLQFGTDFKIKNFMLGVQYLKPIAQNWNAGYSCHESKVSVRILYFFSNK